jgi:hypothetical protein
MSEINSLAREIALSACIERLRSESGRVEIKGVEWRDIDVEVNGVQLGSVLKKELRFLKIYGDQISFGVLLWHPEKPNLVRVDEGRI